MVRGREGCGGGRREGWEWAPEGEGQKGRRQRRVNIGREEREGGNGR